jgi:DNA-binding XRE family transcriptional regulator
VCRSVTDGGNIVTRFQEELRALRGLRTQEQFAQELGVTRVTVAVWETGAGVPKLRNARKLVERGMNPSVVLEAVTRAAKRAAA